MQASAQIFSLSLSLPPSGYVFSAWEISNINSSSPFSLIKSVHLIEFQVSLVTSSFDVLRFVDSSQIS